MIILNFIFLGSKQDNHCNEEKLKKSKMGKAYRIISSQLDLLFISDLNP